MSDSTSNTDSSEELKELFKDVKELSKTYKSLGKAEFIKSGSTVFDALLGGGIPKGVFILWSAENGCGKSTGALHIARAYCMQGKRVLYLDYEGGVNDNQIDGMGLRQYLYDPETNPEGIFILYQVQTYRDAEEILDKIMSKINLVVIDSMTAILTEKVKSASSEDVLPGIDARVSSTFMKRYKAEAVRQGTTWIMINQIRTHIGMSFGQQTYDDEAGGQALKFYPDIRLRMKKAFKGSLEREEETANGKQKVPFGSICTIYAQKNRYERPFIPLNIAIIFGKGISNEFAYFDWLQNEGSIKKSGAWYNISINDHTEKIQGQNNVVDWIQSNKAEIKSYIDSHGGYKLLINSSEPVDINVEDVEELKSLYDEDMTSGTEFITEEENNTD